MTRKLALSAGLTLVLAGCGGGDGDNGMVRASAPESPVPASVARQAGGLSAPTFTAAQIERHDQAVLESADTFVLSDWLYVNPDAQTEDDVFIEQTVECVDGTCYRATNEGTGIKAITIQGIAAEAREPRPGYRVYPIGQRSGVWLAAATDEGEFAPGEYFSAASYGGWLDYSAFGIDGTAFIGGEFDEWVILYSYSYGKASGTNPAVGTATWTGIVAGVDVSVSETAGNTIQGQARIDFDLDGEVLPTLGGVSYWPTVDVAFTQMYDLDTATRRSDMRWNNMQIENGSFSFVDLVSGSIDGRFYGPNHEEVGGVFDSKGFIGDDIIGAFGGIRE